MWQPAIWHMTATAVPGWRHRAGTSGYMYRLPAIFIHGIHDVLATRSHHLLQCFEVTVPGGLMLFRQPLAATATATHSRPRHHARGRRGP